MTERRSPFYAGIMAFVGEEDVGCVTYSDHGYSLGKVLATAHLELGRTAPGTALTVGIDGAPVRAVVASMPFFDPEGARLRA